MASLIIFLDIACIHMFVKLMAMCHAKHGCVSLPCECDMYMTAAHCIIFAALSPCLLSYPLWQMPEHVKGRSITRRDRRKNRAGRAALSALNGLSASAAAATRLALPRSSLDLSACRAVWIAPALLAHCASLPRGLARHASAVACDTREKRHLAHRVWRNRRAPRHAFSAQA